MKQAAIKSVRAKYIIGAQLLYPKDRAKEGNKPLKWALVALCYCTIALALDGESAKFEELAGRAADALDRDPGQAAALYEQALALRPEWGEGWLYRGAALFQLARFTEARDSLRKGVALDPNKGTPLAFLGVVEYETGDYQAALSDILKGEAIGLPDKPDFVTQVYYRGALIYLRSGDFSGALEQLRPLAKHGLASPAAKEALGLSTLGLSYLPGSVPSDKRALVDLAGRAAWAFLAERTQQAAPLFEQLRTEFPDQRGVHYMTGVFLIDRDRQDARREFRKELQITPSHILARVQLAQLLIRDGSVTEALRLAGEAARLAPSDALCQVTLGQTLLKAGRTKEAITALEKGEKLAPQVPKTHFYLLQAYRRAGRVADAEKEKAEWERLHAAQEPVGLLERLEH